MMKKIIAASIVTTILIGNSIFITNAVEWPYKHELTHTNVKLKHVPFWLFDNDISKEETGKSSTECIKGGSFSVLDDQGNVISNYSQEGCNNNKILYNGAGNDEGNFIENLFGTDFFGEDGENKNISGENATYQEQKNSNPNSEQDDFLNDLFGDSFEGEQEGAIIIDNENGEEQNSTDETGIENEGLQDIDALFGDIFGKSIEQNTNISVNIEQIDIKKRKLKYIISQKKKRILSKKISLIQSL